MLYKFPSYKPINSPKLNLYTFFFDRPRSLLGAEKKSISSKKVLAGGAFKTKMGFETKIKIVAEAKVEVEVGKFSTASRSANSNIEGLDINNPAKGLIALNRPRFFFVESLNKIENVDIALIAVFLVIFKKPK